MNKIDKILISIMTVLVLLIATFVIFIFTNPSVFENFIFGNSPNVNQTASNNNGTNNATNEEIIISNISVQETTAATNPAPLDNSQRQYIFMGDSRSVCLYKAMAATTPGYAPTLSDDNTGVFEQSFFIAKTGMGYDWCISEAYPKLMQIVNANSVIILWFGVNDLYDSQRYIDFINQQLVPLNIPIFYVTVGPSTGNYAYLEPRIQAFNNVIQTQMNPAVHIIDGYSFIRSGLDDDSFHSSDGLHYTDDTSRAVYNFLMGILISSL